MSFYGEWLACGNPLEEQLYIKTFLKELRNQVRRYLMETKKIWMRHML